MILKLAAALVGLLAVVRPVACVVVAVDKPEEGCPACDGVFEHLETTPTGERVRVTNYQERGEPKSGTALMLYWTASAIMHTCDYLKYYFGDESCETQWFRRDSDSGTQGNQTFTFEFQPRRGRGSARCPCTTVDKVQITLSSTGKHSLPVNGTCPWYHPGGISAFKMCTTPEGQEVEGYQDLWHCMHDAGCSINDDRHQLAILRDPRAMVVSTYFFRRIHTRKSYHDVPMEEFVLEALPSLAQWIGIRYILFEGILADRSTVLYYEEMMENPVGFHYHLLHALGLQLPADLVENIAAAADRGDFPFRGVKGIDPHPGGENATRARSFEDEVSEEILQHMNEVVRVWLPPPLLARFGIER